MSSQCLGIVIIGFKNTEGISRLLESLDKVDFGNDNNIKLIFSIDYSGNHNVEQIANDYVWKHGEKIVRAYKENLGLRRHIISCGNYMKEFNLDAIIVLEDDIYVSSAVYSYAKAAVNYYYDDPKVTGISLYRHEINDNARHPFTALYDGNDVFFLQYAASWGQVWLRNEWEDFVTWYENKEYEKLDKKKLPQNILGWTNSWLKFHIMYCIATDKYFVYPQSSLTTNFSDVGAHRKNTETSYQVPLLNKAPENWRFCRIDQTKAVYDGFWESKSVSIGGISDDVCVNLNGAKNIQGYRYVISTNDLPYKILKTWGLKLRPIELNVMYDLKGTGIYLYDTTVSSKNKSNSNRVRFEYDLKGIQIVNKIALIYIFHSAWIKLKAKIRLKLKKKRN